MTKLYALLAGAAVGALIIGAAVAVLLGQMDDQASADPYAQCRATTVASGEDVIGGPFTMVNQFGETVTDADVITQPSLLYFGYTFCPDVCSFDTSRNAEAVDFLAEQGHEVTPVFISIDPARDTPEVLDAYAANMHENMIALTGTLEQSQAAQRAYRVYSRINQRGDDPYYLVDHTAFSYLVLPEVGFVEFFRGAPSDLLPSGQTAQEVADSVACFLDATPVDS